MNGMPVHGAIGLHIKTVTGMTLNPMGPVTYKIFDGERVYYCDGASWPAEIVMDVMMERAQHAPAGSPWEGRDAHVGTAV